MTARSDSYGSDLLAAAEAMAATGASATHIVELIRASLRGPKAWPEWTNKVRDQESLKILAKAFDTPSSGPNDKTYDLQDMETHCALAAGKAIGACLPEDPPYEVLKALAGDPIILAASDEEELRRRYGVMRERLLDATRSET